MTAGRDLFIEVTSRDQQNWDTLSPVGRLSWEQRAAGDRTFIPSERRGEHYDVEEESVESVPAPEVLARPAEPGEIPRGAKTVINRAKKNGWTVQASYARGPWIMTRDWNVCNSILVRGRRGEQKFAAQWIRKEWLERDAIIPGHIMLDVWVDEQVIAADPQWSFEICRVNDNNAESIKAGDLKAIIEKETS